MTMVIDLESLIDFKEKYALGDTTVSVVSNERGVLIRVICRGSGSVEINDDKWKIINARRFREFTVVYVEGVGKVGTIL
jgi:membrane protein implicated in regulation of membrane protease activity